MSFRESEVTGGSACFVIFKILYPGTGICFMAAVRKEVL